MGDAPPPDFIKPSPAYISETYGDANHAMAIDLTDMHDSGYVKLSATIEDIRQHWKTVVDTWDGLLVNWAGGAADESKLLLDRVDALQTKLLGAPSKKDPKIADPAGILDYVQGLIMAAKYDLDLAETNVKDMFQHLIDSLHKTSDTLYFDVDKDGKADLNLPGGKQSTNRTLGPVTESYTHPYNPPHVDGDLVGKPPPKPPPHKPRDFTDDDFRNPPHTGGPGPKAN